MNKTAIISGITGQDGAYLAQLLLCYGYKVIGLTRSYSSNGIAKLKFLKIYSEIIFEECDLLDSTSIHRIIQKYRPNEFYNLAAQSSVGASFNQPIGTIHFNTISVLNVLEAIKLINPETRFYQASTSEMFGKVEQLPVHENTVLNPTSPYGISKAAAHWIVRNYREAYGLFACSGILFNHESVLRDEQFFVKKVIVAALKIKENQLDKLKVGNINIKRDFGYSPDYVKAMYAMLQQPNPDDFVISSGKSILLKDIVEYVFNYLQIPLDKYEIDENLYRPAEILDIYGDNTKSKNKLGWKYERNFFSVLEEMIELSNKVNLGTI